jgi:hypothetical protein
VGQRLVVPAELELAVGEPRERVGVPRIEPDRFGELVRRLLVAAQHQQVEPELLVGAGLLRAHRDGAPEERFRDVRGAQL